MTVAMDGNPALEAVALGRRFGSVQAVANLDLRVRRGELFALVGPDGAGKSTTLRLLAGVLAPSTGRVSIFGLDLAREGEKARLRLGYAAQNFSLYGDLAVAENLEFFARVYGVAPDELEGRRGELLAFSNLAGAEHRQAGLLSGGMKQKLALYCALIHDPDLLLLDEPTTGVDPVSRRELWSIIAGLLARGKTIVLSTPYLDEAERCTRVALLDRGRLIATDTPEALVAASPGARSLEDVFIARTGAEHGPTTVGTAALVPTRALCVSGPAIDVEHLSRRFGDLTAVDDVSFSVERGEIFGFLGPNGAGKTTAIRMICGILAPSAGTVRVLDRDVARDPEGIRQEVGYMSQRFGLYGDLTVSENLAFYGRVYGVRGGELREQMARLIAMAGLTGRERAHAATLSGGWRQRLALGCALIHRPPVLLLDEPTGGVDPISRRDFWELISGLAEAGVTVLVSTHYMDEAEHCDRVALMHAGRLVALDTPAALKAGLQGAILEVRGVPLAPALRALAAWQPALYGTALHIRASGSGEAGRIRQALAAAGMPDAAIAAIQPSLEDVFLAMVAGERSHEIGSLGGTDTAMTR